MGMEPGQLDPRLQVALFTASVTIILWVLKQFADLGWRIYGRRQRRNSFIRGLYAELRFNVAELTDAAANGVKIADIKDAMHARPDTIPHMTDARHDDIYRTRLADLPLIDDDLIAQIIRFYGRMEKIRVQIDGLNLPSYATISINGRLKVMDRINTQIATAATDGQALLDTFENSYSTVLKVKKDAPPPKKLAESFTSNDDGVGSGHEKSSKDTQ